MRLKTVVKWSTTVLVLLFCLALGGYAFMQLDMAGRNRNVNLFSLVPSDCVGVLYSDDIYSFLDNYPEPNYKDELDKFQYPGLFEFILNGLKDYMGQDTHGLNGQMGHLMVSFHAPDVSLNQVIYLNMNSDDGQILSDMLREYAPDGFLHKEEKYRGKVIRIYPLGSDEFLASYTEKDCCVLSFQKRLIERVIDAKLDETSLDDDEAFRRMPNKKKRNFLTLYARSSFLPFLEFGPDCWSEYEFHLNSDVLYLTGETASDRVDRMSEQMQELPFVEEERLILSADKDSTKMCIEKAMIDEDENRTLFNECVANLASDASFTLVADMEAVAEQPERFDEYLPKYILEHKDYFLPFILSVQLNVNEGRLSHIWVFTYKD